MLLSKQTIGAVLRFGVKYAPVAYAGLRGRGGTRGSGSPWSNQPRTDDARSMAFEHAAHLVDGSVLPVFHGDARVWVVFSGELPVASHPVVRTPLPLLLEHYDLAKRQRPGQEMPIRGRPVPHPSRRLRLAASRRKAQSEH